MKTLSAICVVLFAAACGSDEPKVATVPADHAHPDMVPVDHDHPDMVPVVHEHPESEPVGPLESTGTYAVTGVLTVDTCADPSLASEDELDLGEWIVAAVGDDYIFFQDGIMLFSLSLIHI